jgi:hypothetical protein
MQNPKPRFPKTSLEIAKLAMCAMHWPSHDDHNQQLASKECIVLRALALVYGKWGDNAGEKDETEFEFGDGQGRVMDRQATT